MLDRLTIERMAAEAGDGPILIALSGGGDSVALMHLLAETFGPTRLHAAIVDHALRPGSNQDALHAQEIARALGIAADIATLTWPQGPQRSQARAREARYAALCAAAHSVGARVIATGHTRDDQAETVLLRAARGSGWRGLAGMRSWAGAPVWPEGRGLRLARPLLGTRRAALRDQLRARGAAWIEDPANANEAFARVRARRALGEQGHDPMRLAALAERLTPHALKLDEAARALIAASAVFEDDTILIAPQRWRGAAAVRQRALSVLIAAAGAGAGEPPAEQVAALEARFAQAAFKGATLAGARLARGDRGVTLSRDSGALSGRADGAAPLAPLAIEANAACVWDRRLLLTAQTPGWTVVVEAGRPVLARGEARQPLTAVPTRWLLDARVAHLLVT